MEKFITVVGTIIILIGLGFMIKYGIVDKQTIVNKSEYTELVRVKDFYSNHLHKGGWTEEFGSYHLRSFDNGVSWYAFDVDNLLGNVDSIYPGLIKHIEAWDNITKFVEKNGTINEDNYKLLETDLNEVGITIEEKDIFKNE